MTYQRTQWGWIALPILVVVIAVMLLTVVVADELAEVFWWSIAFIAAICLVVGHFSRLTVTVDDDAVTVAFGLINRPHRTIPFDDVVEVQKVRNKWWYGYGVRWIPDGLMYNVQGNDAVELTYPTGKKFRIGTDDVDGLYAVLAQKIPTSPS